MLRLSAFTRSPRGRMLLAGGCSSLSAYSTFLVLNAHSVHYTAASIAAFVVYLLCNFLLNRYWSFKSTAAWHPQALQHVALHTGNQGLILVGLYVCVEWLSAPAALGQLVLQVVAFLTAFLLTSIIFGHRRTK